MIFSLIYQSIIIVILLTFSFGPSFFSLINYSIKKGFRQASTIAVGVVSSDFIICMLTVFLLKFGFTEWLDSPKHQRFAGILAGIILIVFGFFYFKKEPVISESIDEFSVKNENRPTLLFFKGFFINFFNPTVWFLWLGNVTIISTFFQHSLIKTIIYFLILNSIVLTIELYKVYLGNKLKKILTHNIIHIVNIVTGITLIIFGLVLIYNYYFEKI
ncbi:MAG: LysE family transporter [Bacteroidia bacterium]|nr:LysE family transporter [Bacteroidia bacterium]